MSKSNRQVIADKKREQEEYDNEEFLKEKDELMGLYWLTDEEPA